MLLAYMALKQLRFRCCHFAEVFGIKGDNSSPVFNVGVLAVTGRVLRMFRFLNWNGASPFLVRYVVSYRVRNMRKTRMRSLDCAGWKYYGERW